MADLTSLQETEGDDPILVVDQENASQVEPLSGPVDLTPDVLLDRFPETVYDRSIDSHLYKLIASMCGDAGVGLIKKQSYIARLRNEGEVLQFGDLDTFYATQFAFQRLKNEMYANDPDIDGVDPDVDSLTAVQWQKIESMDTSYKQRVNEFMQATRLGNSPDGIELAAMSGTGIHVETVENYKAIFDAYSDDVKNITYQGYTTSSNEFILTPRILDSSGNADPTISYESRLLKNPNPNAGIVNWTRTALPGFAYLNPDIERNMVDILDRLRPVSALMSVKTRDVHYVPLTAASVFASSEEVTMTRFVTGNPNVTWPTPDASTGEFIQASIETESTSLSNSSRSLPVVYHTLNRASAYTEQALQDDTYNTAAFYSGVNGGTPPFQRYQSEMTGAYYSAISNLYTFLKNAPNDIIYSADKALAAQNTPITIESNTR